MKSPDRVPVKQEVERHLDRVLSWDVFTNRSQQAKLLALITELALSETDVTEKILRERLFPTPPYREDSNIARRTVDLLRDTLNDYYAGPGLNDPIRISIPRTEQGKRTKFQTGKAYTPTFLYNPNSRMIRDLKKARRLIAQATGEDATRAASLLATEGSETPLIGEVLATTIETFFLNTLQDFHAMPDMDRFLAEIREIALSAVSYDQTNWHSHAVLATVYYLARQPQLAQEEFSLAIKYDHNRGRRYPDMLPSF